MFSLALPRRASKRLQPHEAVASNWADSHLNPRAPPVMRSTMQESKPEYPSRLPMRYIGNGNTRFDTFQSQSIKRPQMDVYFTEINWRGITSPGQVASRAQFCADKRIQPKDLRLLDSKSRGTSLSVQGEVIIIRTDGFRALITSQSVVILDDSPVIQKEKHQLTIPEDNNEVLAFSHRTECIINLLKELSNFESESLKQYHAGDGYQGVSFELIALASILDVIFVSLERELNRLKFTVEALLCTLQKEIQSQIMEQLLQSNHQLQNFIETCSNLQQCIYAVSDNAQKIFQAQDSTDPFANDNVDDEASAVIYHTDLLLLLGEYSAEEIIDEGKDLMKKIRMKEETANLIINSNQVDLVYVGLKLEAITIGVTFGALLTGAFGMNLKNGAEEHEFAFFVVLAIILLLCAMIIFFGWIQIRKVGRNC